MAVIIRQEIPIFATSTALYAVAASGTQTSNEIIQTDTTQYTGATFYFEIEADTSLSITGSKATLRRKGTSTDDATCTIPLLTTSPTLIRSSSFTPNGTTQDYVVFMTGGAGATTNFFSARIVIIQNAATITATESQICVGPQPSTGATSSATFVAGNPNYWIYTSANWDGTITAFWEAVVNSRSTKITVTAELQVSDGTGDNFAGFAAVGSDLTDATGVAARKRSTSFTLTAGRAYRIVFKSSSSKSTVDFFCGKIIIDQSASPTKIEAQYFLSNGIQSGTALQTALTSWASGEWSSVTNTYEFCLDAANGSTSVGELDTVGGTQVTGSVVTSPDNQGSSSSMTMPSDGNLEFKITTNNSDVYGARILVAVVITATFGPEEEYWQAGPIQLPEPIITVF